MTEKISILTFLLKLKTSSSVNDQDLQLYPNHQNHELVAKFTENAINHLLRVGEVSIIGENNVSFDITQPAKLDGNDVAVGITGFNSYCRFGLKCYEDQVIANQSSLLTQLSLSQSYGKTIQELDTITSNTNLHATVDRYAALGLLCKRIVYPTCQTASTRLKTSRSTILLLPRYYSHNYSLYGFDIEPSDDTLIRVLKWISDVMKLNDITQVNADHLKVHFGLTKVNLVFIRLESLNFPLHMKKMNIEFNYDDNTFHEWVIKISTTHSHIETCVGAACLMNYGGIFDQLMKYAHVISDGFTTYGVRDAFDVPRKRSEKIVSHLIQDFNMKSILCQDGKNTVQRIVGNVEGALMSYTFDQMISNFSDNNNHNIIQDEQSEPAPQAIDGLYESTNQIFESDNISTHRLRRLTYIRSSISKSGGILNENALPGIFREIDMSHDSKVVQHALQDLETHNLITRAMISLADWFVYASDIRVLYSTDLIDLPHHLFLFKRNAFIDCCKKGINYSITNTMDSIDRVWKSCRGIVSLTRKICTTIHDTSRLKYSRGLHEYLYMNPRISSRQVDNVDHVLFVRIIENITLRALVKIFNLPEHLLFKSIFDDFDTSMTLSLGLTYSAINSNIKFSEYITALFSYDHDFALEMVKYYTSHINDVVGIMLISGIIMIVDHHESDNNITSNEFPFLQASNINLVLLMPTYEWCQDILLGTDLSSTHAFDSFWMDLILLNISSPFGINSDTLSNETRSLLASYYGSIDILIDDLKRDSLHGDSLYTRMVGKKRDLQDQNSMAHLVGYIPRIPKPSKQPISAVVAAYNQPKRRRTSAKSNASPFGANLSVTPSHTSVVEMDHVAEREVVKAKQQNMRDIVVTPHRPTRSKPVSILANKTRKSEPEGKTKESLVDEEDADDVNNTMEFKEVIWTEQQDLALITGILESYYSSFINDDLNDIEYMDIEQCISEDVDFEAILAAKPKLSNYNAIGHRLNSSRKRLKDLTGQLSSITNILSFLTAIGIDGNADDQISLLQFLNQKSRRLWDMKSSCDHDSLRSELYDLLTKLLSEEDKAKRLLYDSFLANYDKVEVHRAFDCMKRLGMLSLTTATKIQAIEVKDEYYSHADGELYGLLYEALKTRADKSSLPDCMASLAVDASMASSFPFTVSYFISHGALTSIDSIAFSVSKDIGRHRGSVTTNAMTRIPDQTGIYVNSLNRVKGHFNRLTIENSNNLSIADTETYIPSEVDQVHAIMDDIFDQSDHTIGIMKSRLVKLVKSKLPNCMLSAIEKGLVDKCECLVRNTSCCRDGKVECRYQRKVSDITISDTLSGPWMSIDGSVHENMLAHFESVVISYLMKHPLSSRSRIHAHIPILSSSQMKSLLQTMQDNRMLACRCSHQHFMDQPFLLASTSSMQGDDNFVYHLL